ncbi:PE-PPE domain-containing protein [Gordonia humi]
MRTKVAATTVAGVMAAGLAAPAWAASPFEAVLDEYSEPAADPGEFRDVLDRWVSADQLDDVLVVVTPGTDDTGLGPRTAGLVADHDARIVKYPGSFWPVSSGSTGALLPFFAPTYDASKNVAVDANLAIMAAMRGTGRVVVYTGYSQGSDALGDAAERAAADGLLDGDTLVLLVSDPRGPWGLKSGLEKIPFHTPIMALIGAQSNGARDPGKTGDAEVVQVIVKGDPVANWQWNPLRPVSSLLVDLAGFITIHGSTGPYTYAHLENLELEKTLYSAEGNTRYEVYDTYHPLALLNAMIAAALGIEVDEAQLAEWDRQAEFFYPMQDVAPETADPGVGVVTEKPEGRHTLHDAAGRAVESEPSAAGEYEGRHRAEEVETVVDVPTPSTPNAVAPAVRQGDPVGGAPRSESAADAAPADDAGPTDGDPIQVGAPTDQTAPTGVVTPS